MVAASMTVGELGSCAAVREAHELMSQADAEGRKARPREPSDSVERVAHRRWVARAVGKENAIRL